MNEEEKKFEKKSTKKVAKVIIIVVLVLLLAGAGIFAYNMITKKPEKLFNKAIEEALDTLEKDSEKTKGKVDLELSIKANSKDEEVKQINEALKLIKLKLSTELDMDKKILNESINLTVLGQEVLGVEGVIKNEKMYLYLDELYSKYIEIPEDELEGISVSEIFENSENLVNEKLLGDIKQILMDEVNSREISQETVKVNGKNATKSTLRLTPKEVGKIALKVLEKINEYEYNEEIYTLIEEIKEKLEYELDSENYLDIILYSNGLKNDLFKYEIQLVNKEDDEFIGLEILKEEENTTARILMNEESSKANDAKELVKVVINEQDENKGTIKVSVNAEEVEVIFNINYKVDYDAEIKTKNTSNSIELDELTEEDYMEIYDNIQNNEFLSGILSSFIEPVQVDYIY